jgi:hypothetical protein
MYCVKCGVELADSEKSCPLCGTAVICPDGIVRAEKESPYPPHPGKITEGISKIGVLFIISLAAVISLIICLLADININGQLNWSGYVMFSLVLLYTSCILPLWFNKPNPVIFVPCDFAAATLYLWFINLLSGGNWFLTFALPVAVATALLTTAPIALLHYIRKGHLFIFGSASILFGAFLVQVETLLWVTFSIPFYFWSVYPLIGFVLLGIALIIIGICRPLREALTKKFFV